jgi:hypothetical protein
MALMRRSVISTSTAIAFKMEMASAASVIHLEVLPQHINHHPPQQNLVLDEEDLHRLRRHGCLRHATYSHSSRHSPR